MKLLISDMFENIFDENIFIIAVVICTETIFIYVVLQHTLYGGYSVETIPKSYKPTETIKIYREKNIYNINPIKNFKGPCFKIFGK